MLFGKLPTPRVNRCLHYGYSLFSTFSVFCPDMPQYHTQALRHIRPILDVNTARLVGHALVSSRHDYANPIMYGMSKSLTAKLQRQQNMLARVVLRTNRTSLASSGIEDPVQNSYSHTQNSQHRHTTLFVLSAEPLQTNSTASFNQLKSPGTTTLQN